MGAFNPKTTLQLRISRRQVLRRGAALGMSLPLVSGLLAACGGSNSSTTTTTATSSAATAAPSAASTTANSAATPTTAASAAASPTTTASVGTTTPQAVATTSGVPTPVTRGGNLIVAQVDPHYGWDPATMDFDSRMTSRAIYDPLVELDYQGNFVPGLIASWEQPDDKTYLLHPQQGVTFHDGTPFDVDAVKFHFDRHLGRTTPPVTSLRKSELGPVDTVTIVDSNTVKVTLTEPFAPFLSGYFDWSGFVISPTAAQKLGKDYAFHPVGTGPFKFVSYALNQQTIVERNENYWRKGEPYLDKITFSSIATSSGQETALRTGAAHIATSIGFQDVTLLKGISNIVVSEKPGFRWDAFVFNTKKDPWTNATLRSALNWAVDRDAIQSTTYFNTGSPGYEPYFLGDKFCDANYKPFTRDVNKAKQLIEQSGVSGPLELTALVSNADAVSLKNFEILQGNLNDVGIKLSIKSEDPATSSADVRKGDFDFSTNWWGYRPDPDSYIYQLFDGKGSQVYYSGFYDDPKIDQLIEAGRAEQDFSKRFQIYQQLAAQINQDASWIFFHYGSDLKALSKNVEGYLHFQDSMIRFQWISLKS